MCSNNDETQCFNVSFTRAREYVDAFNGPCTKVEYSIASRQFANSRRSDETKFRVTFDPLSVEVSEEYLISNIVAMVGAIGGTLGMFTGFSFTGFFSTSIICFQKIYLRVINKAQEDQESTGALIIQTMSSEAQTEVRFEDQTARQNIAKLDDRVLSLEKSVEKLKHQVSQQEEILKDQIKKHIEKASE